MASHSSVGLTNGVNGTANVKDDEHPTTMEVKPILREGVIEHGHVQGIVSQFGLQFGLQAVHQPGFIAAPQPEIIHPEIHHPAVNLPGSVTAQQEITGGAGFTDDQSHQPDIVTAPQEITGGAGFIADASHQPDIVTTPQEITGGAGFIADASPQPGFVTTPQEITGGAGFIADASPQPGFVTTSQEITGGAGFIADASPQPGLVTSPQERTEGAGFVADASPQPGLVTSPQEITGGAGFVADISHEPSVVTSPQEITVGAGFITDASPQPGFVALPQETTQSQQPQLVAAPQQITGGPAFTREVKDVSLITVPGVLPGSTFNVPQFAINALNQIAGTEGFSDYFIEYERGSNHGDGFVAEIIRAVIKGNQIIKGTQEECELVLVVKLPPENKVLRQQKGMNVFEREVMVYNEILPLFQQFQLDKGLKPGQGFVSFPKCYLALYDKEKDEAVIIMEDIRKKGFKMQSKYRPVDLPHARTVLETVAQFHGLSMAMKDQRPEVFEKYRNLKDMMDYDDAKTTDMMKSMTALNCEKAVETLEPNEEHIKEKLRAFSENIVEIIKESSSGELSEPYSVLNHGDCWINNMMFKYQSGFPRHLCLLDWQVVRYASPVLDICYFLYICTDSELRRQHFDNLIQSYHISLRKQVELLGSDVNQILPFTALLREMKTKAKFALCTAIFIIPMLCMPNAEIPTTDELVENFAKGDMSENNMFIMSSNTEAAYKKRMSGIIRDMHKKGYL